MCDRTAITVQPVLSAAQSGTAMLAESVASETPHRRKSPDKARPKQQPRYHVILLDDDDHTYGYVVQMLQELFAYPVERGYLLAKRVDTLGRVIVLTTTKEHAELKRDQIQAFGADPRIPRCQGSMSAVIEPVPE
ncbi:MAG: ATP-dependent Clp protease adaptor ClpS [Planctomycetaceae bacterium]|nr:ATP-dependent Clp protease adaptor ClpS [Planctomycetaceae bacterium]